MVILIDVTGAGVNAFGVVPVAVVVACPGCLGCCSWPGSCGCCSWQIIVVLVVLVAVAV